MEGRKPARGGCRVGAGRKPIDSPDRLRSRSVYLTDKEWDHCHQQWSWEVSASEYVRHLVQRDIRRQRQRDIESEGADAEGGANPD
jgi:hypothetical protein